MTKEEIEKQELDALETENATCYQIEDFSEFSNLLINLKEETL